MAGSRVGFMRRVNHDRHPGHDQPVQLDGLEDGTLAVLAGHLKDDHTCGRLAGRVGGENPADQPALPVEQLKAERRSECDRVVAIAEVELTLRRY